MNTPAPNATAAITTAGVLLDRMKAGETLHRGYAPGEARKKGWWLRPSMTPVSSAAVKALRAIVPTASTELQVL